MSHVTRPVTRDTLSIMPDQLHRRYYKINKFFLSLIGQWPYQSRARRRALLVLFVLLATSQIIPQIMAVVEFSDDPEVVIESISPFVIDVACGTKLANIVINSDKMFQLVERMRVDSTSLIGQPEIRVLHDYANIGRQFTIAYAAGVFIVTALFMTQPVAPQILVALKITDQVQEKKFPFPVDYYGLDFETYYYGMVVHSYFAVAAIVTVIVAADTMFMVYVQHACGMFTVVGHQLERLGGGSSENYEFHSGPSKDRVYQQLSACIRKHNEAIEFANLLESSYTWSFFSFLGLNMMMMSVTGFQTVMRLDDNPEESLRYAAFTIAQMAHLFFQSFFSQRLMDHSQRVREYTYQAEWYKTSVCAQKLLNLVTMRTYAPCRLTAGGFMVMSLENFTAVVKTSMSYFTLLRSMQ